MAYVRAVTPEDADARGVGALYEHIGNVTGAAPSPFFQRQAVRPDLARPIWDWFEALMLQDGLLGRQLKELIATRTSLANACRYCSAAHSFRATLQGAPKWLVDRLSEPVDLLGLDGRQRALFAFCDRVRESSPEIGEQDWEGVRRAGWTDEEIIEAIQVVAMFSAFNRMADAFGVEFTPPAHQPRAAASLTG